MDAEGFLYDVKEDFDSKTHSPRKSSDTSGGSHVNLNKLVNYSTWVSNHPFVPKGWKIKEVKMGEETMFRYLSPDGRGNLLGKAAALKFLLDKNYSEQEVQEMRETMKYEGWWNDGLPKGWMYRMSGNQICFITSTGEHVVGMETALDWLKRVGDSQEINILETFISDQE